MAKNESKIEWLRVVFEQKDVLFGAFSDKLTKNDKVTAWRSMHAMAQSLALVPVHKDYLYTRDVFWQNIRKNAMKKRDNSRATGSGTTKFSNIDEMVFSIIGKESPTLVGLPVPESGEEDLLSGVDVSGTSTVHDVFPSTSNSQGGSALPATKSKLVNKPVKKHFKNKLEGLKYKKLKLMILLLEKENYLKELKIKKLEKELNLSTNEKKKVQVDEEASTSSTEEESYEFVYLEDLE